jgi:DNA-binding transcriptional LysR family regulator
MPAAPKRLQHSRACCFPRLLDAAIDPEPSMNTDHVSAFYWAATLESVTAAAKRLELSQPTVSTRIQCLEKDLEVQLFDRDPFRLTSAGRRALPLLTRFWEHEQKVMAELAQSASRPVRFRLGVIESVLHSSLSELIADLRAHEPKLELEMAVHTSLELEKLVEQGALDLVVAASPAAGKDMQTCSVAPMALVFVGSRARHTRSHYALDELAELGLIGFQPKSQPHRHLTKLLAEQSRDAVMHTASSISGMVALVNAGFGVATLPRVVAERLMTDKSGLCILPCRQELSLLPIHISYRIDPGEPRHAEIVRRVVAFLQWPPAAKS